MGKAPETPGEKCPFRLPLELWEAALKNVTSALKTNIPSVLLPYFMANITAKATGIKAGRGQALIPPGSRPPPPPRGSGGRCVLGRHLVVIGHTTV